MLPLAPPTDARVTRRPPRPPAVPLRPPRILVQPTAIHDTSVQQQPKGELPVDSLLILSARVPGTVSHALPSLH